MNGALIFQWRENIPGREAKSVEAFGKAISWFEQLTKQGKLHGHREYMSLTGGTGGFMLAEGDLTELKNLIDSDDAIRISTEAAASVSGFKADVLVGGSDRDVQGLMNTYGERMKELGYM
ncbi:MAG TPA: hypothetical protein VF163_06990 [Micromonosporaceae bacterium]